MLMRVALVLLFCATVVQPRPDFCGTQPCPLSMRCLKDTSAGTSVCVRYNPPTCAATSCRKGQKCVLLELQCRSLPCDPKPYCVTKNPCRICSAPRTFCQLVPYPVCRFVVEPTCENRLCKPWERCVERVNPCLIPPCPVSLLCKPIWYKKKIPGRD